LVEYKVFST